MVNDAMMYTRSIIAGMCSLSDYNNRTDAHVTGWLPGLLILPALILLHLWFAPYTKVEESFNIQAAHDLLYYGIPLSNVSEQINAQYDHITFSGAVPRSFIGALVLAGLSRPVLWVNDAVDRQFLGQ